MRCVGYRQVWNYLDGKNLKNEMIEKGVAATRQLAKRQLTWLRGMENIHWFDSVAGPQSALFSLLGLNLNP
jgi:tRNA dimethylallyltransferase